MEKLERIIKARTPGPWSNPDANTDDIIRGADGKRIVGCCCCGGFSRVADGEFVTAVGTLADLMLDVMKAATTIRLDHDTIAPCSAGCVGCSIERPLLALSAATDKLGEP